MSSQMVPCPLTSGSFVTGIRHDIIYMFAVILRIELKMPSLSTETRSLYHYPYCQLRNIKYAQYLYVSSSFSK